MDQFDQPRQPGPARQRVRLYVEQFLALAREGSQGDDDEQAPRIDVLNHVTLDVRDLRVLSAEPPGNAELDAARAEVAALEKAPGGAALDSAVDALLYQADATIDSDLVAVAEWLRRISALDED